MSTDKPLFQLTQFQFGFDAKKGLCAPFDLTLTGTQMIFVLGPNGSGKTTFLRTLSGLQKNISPQSLATRAPESVAFFPSQWDLDPSLTIGDLESLFLKSVDQERLANLRAKWWSVHSPQQRITQLSSGERQKVLLGLVLSRRTQIFVLDEPQNFLEPAIALDLLDLLQQLTAEGCLVVCATHDLSWCARMQKAHCLLLKGPSSVPISGNLTEVLRSQDFQEVFRVRAQFWHDRETAGGVTFSKI